MKNPSASRILQCATIGIEVWPSLLIPPKHPNSEKNDGAARSRSGRRPVRSAVWPEYHAGPEPTGVAGEWDRVPAKELTTSDDDTPRAAPQSEAGLSPMEPQGDVDQSCQRCCNRNVIQETRKMARGPKAECNQVRKKPSARTKLEAYSEKCSRRVLGPRPNCWRLIAPGT